ncbi:glycosyl hydrolases family 31-domain-containing protein [Mycotypha africana]|uniref:glycosyl hydrolases family 31-domain-containing protein n=1 Tax=Mycotypha africana TaxID=64632 RepID=UPI0023016CAF|nr:glycosyl hydrolases family 31-domain-containing protein [Mycotypha africana]KAI8991603.1 glycosyl hydrolases family 31-domain-containing protein [Mycotypha africana]
MLQSVLKSIGLAPVGDYIQPRLSIGNAVASNEFSTGHFTIQIDSEKMCLMIKNGHGRIIWKSLHNIPFLSSSVGKDTISPGDNGVFRVTEHDEKPTCIQTITKIEKADESTVKIYGGLGPKLVVPTHMDYVMTFREVSHRQLEFSIEVTQRDPVMQDYARLFLTYETRAEEHFYGFGEQFSNTSLKGHKVPILVREQGAGRGAHSSALLKESAMSMLGGYGTADLYATYASVPQYISSDVRSLFLENTEYMSFDMTQPERVTIRLESDKMKGRILDGRTMLDLLTEYTSFAGRMKTLPDWVSQGVIAGIHGGKDRARDLVQNLRLHDVPTSALFLQDWTGERLTDAGRGVRFTRHWYNWESDEDFYPELDNFIQELADNDKGKIRVISYVNPMLVDTARKPRYRRNLFLEAQQSGYLVKGRQTGDKALTIRLGNDMLAGLIDLTNPEAREWFKGILKEQVFSHGISGLMADLGEHLPCDTDRVTLHSGESVATYHNRYPEEWAKLIQEVVSELGKESEAVCFFRSGYTHSPSYMNLFCTGDQNVTWDQYHGIKSAVIGMLSGGFSGFSVTHCDAGGYNTASSNIPGIKMVRNKELLFRWMELASCTAAFRTSEGIIPSVNAQFYDDDDSFAQLSHCAKLFIAFSDYRRVALREAYERGWPLLRHPVLYYPNDKTVRELSYQQFFMGSSVMIAPVLAPATAYVKVYFPKDAQKISWRHIWTGKYYPGDGSYQTIDAPIGQPAIFIKEPRDDDSLLNRLMDYATTYYQQKAHPPAAQ